jgi:hypothetical protein
VDRQKNVLGPRDRKRTALTQGALIIRTVSTFQAENVLLPIHWPPSGILLCFRDPFKVKIRHGMGFPCRLIPYSVQGNPIPCLIFTLKGSRKHNKIPEGGQWNKSTLRQSCPLPISGAENVLLPIHWPPSGILLCNMNCTFQSV